MTGRYFSIFLMNSDRHRSVEEEKPDERVKRQTRISAFSSYISAVLTNQQITDKYFCLLVVVVVLKGFILVINQYLQIQPNTVMTHSQTLL